MTRHWQGRGISVHPGEQDGSVQVWLRPEVASNLIKTLTRLEQTAVQLPGQMAELKQALEYVITGDDASERAHRQMEAGKGMTPDGGR
jgi:hypothetical protein